jgi:cytochrome c556
MASLKHAVLAVSMLAIGAAVPLPDASGQAPEPAAGETPVLDVIFARRVLMDGIEIYMQEVHIFSQESAAANVDVPFEAAEAADIISMMMLAFPHMYPAGSYVWSEEAEAEDPTAVTLALPTVWENFPDFYERANRVAQQAFDLSRTRPRDARWREMVAELQAECDACHALYMRPQVVPEFPRLE